jgi:hypothetical protein
MFAKSDGPTALRGELVRALAFSEGKVERPGSAGLVESVAAMAAVWNGKKGYVALLVRDAEPAAIERWVTEGSITSVEALAAATEEGIAFAEELGFTLDSPDFPSLSAEQREARLHRWNKLRKVRKTAAAANSPVPSAPELTPEPVLELTPALALELESNALPTDILDLPDIPGVRVVPSDFEIGPDELAVPAPPMHDLELAAAEPPPARVEPDDTDTTSPPTTRGAVLGRISLVRRGTADARRAEQVARLLAYY